MGWPAEWDRESVRCEIEEATRCGLSVDDPLPETLMAAAQGLGLQPVELRLWIHDEPKHGDWSTQALGRWARRNGIVVDTLCPSCGLPLAHFAGPEKGERGMVCQTPCCDEREYDDEERYGE